MTFALLLPPRVQTGGGRSGGMVRRGTRTSTAGRGTKADRLRSAIQGTRANRAPTPATDPPLPPAPLLAPLALGLTAGSALLLQSIPDATTAIRKLASQVWSLFNQTAPVVPAWEIDQAPYSGMYPPPGNTTPATLIMRRKASLAVAEDSRIAPGSNYWSGPYYCGGYVNINYTQEQYTLDNVIGVSGPRVIPFSHVPTSPFPNCGTVDTLEWQITLSNGSVVIQQAWGVGSAFGWHRLPEFEFIWQGAGAVPWIPPDGAFPEGFVEPAISPAPAKAPDGTPIPAPVPLPVPLTNPGQEPVTQPGPDPATTPATSPLRTTTTTSTSTRAAPKVSGTTLTEAGTLPAPSTAIVPVTNPNITYVGGIPIVPKSPPPTLIGIADEVGRIESKLEALLDPRPDTSTEIWNLLRDLLGPLAEAILASQDQGTYTVTEVCKHPSQSEPLVWEYDWGGKPSAIGNIADRLDKIALMLQRYASLKQPICKNLASGQPVTVQFIESNNL